MKAVGIHIPAAIALAATTIPAMAARAPRAAAKRSALPGVATSS
jgi:hypothetical protein